MRIIDSTDLKIEQIYLYYLTIPILMGKGLMIIKPVEINSESMKIELISCIYSINNVSAGKYTLTSSYEDNIGTIYQNHNLPSILKFFFKLTETDIHNILLEVI